MQDFEIKHGIKDHYSIKTELLDLKSKIHTFNEKQPCYENVMTMVCLDDALSWVWT